MSESPVQNSPSLTKSSRSELGLPVTVAVAGNGSLFDPDNESFIDKMQELKDSKYTSALFAQVNMDSISSKAIAKLIAFITIFILTVIIISLMGRMVRSMIMSTTKLSLFDRLIGGVLGLGKGIIIVVAITFPIQFFPNIYQMLTKDSQTAPYLTKALQLINQKSASFDIRGKLDNLKDINGLYLNKFEDNVVPINVAVED